MTAPRVFVAEADVLTRTGVRVALVDAGFDVVGEAGDTEAALAAVGDAAPDLMLVGATLPGGHLDALRRIASEYPAVRLVVLTTQPSGDELLEAVIAGASGYLGSDVDGSRLPHVLRSVLAGEVALPRRHTERVLEELRARRSRRAALTPHASAPLTDREWEVLELLSGGASSAQIAGRLRITEVTVRRHISATVAKLGVADRAAAVRLMGRSAE